MKYTLLIVIVVPFLTCSCSMLNQKLGLSDDNVIEEAVEAVIDVETGLNIDLTPQDKEVK